MTRDSAFQYAYDRSGNRLTRRYYLGGSLIDTLTIRDSSNIILQLHNVPDAKTTLFAYDDNGSLLGDDRRLYSYDALGRLVSAVDTQDVPSVPVGAYGYDAVGRRALMCLYFASICQERLLGFDGDNVVRLTASPSTPEWRFVHGPGLDDPLVGVFRTPGSGVHVKYYYLTDGSGGQFAFTDVNGLDMTSDPVFYRFGGNQAGAVVRSTEFDQSRATTEGASDFSFFRNRYYDQKTGRFTQEDPIGIAGGVNLYAFAGNNPVAYTDPFGLCPDSLKADGACSDQSKVYFAGVQATDATGKLGFTLATGLYCTGDGCGGYFRWGLAKGRAQTLGPEGGTSDNLDAFRDWALGGGFAYNVVGVSRSGNASGTTTTVTVSHPRVGFKGPSGYIEVTNTLVTPPSPTLRTMLLRTACMLMHCSAPRGTM